MSVARLIVAGTVGAGKSTLVQTVGEIGCISTEAMPYDRAAELKQTTTVALDFSRVSLTPDLMLHLYGTPGQARFDFMWDILLQHADLSLLLIAAHRPETIAPTHEILSFIRQRSQVPITIGVTHSDCSGALSPVELLTELHSSDCPAIVTVNPRDRGSVLEALTIAADSLVQSNR